MFIFQMHSVRLEMVCTSQESKTEMRIWWMLHFNFTQEISSSCASAHAPVSCGDGSPSGPTHLPAAQNLKGHIVRQGSIVHLPSVRNHFARLLRVVVRLVFFRVPPIV